MSRLVKEIKPTHGMPSKKGTANIIFNEATGRYSRKEAVRFITNSGATDVVLVNQNGIDERITPEITSQKISYSATSATFKIKSNTNQFRAIIPENAYYNGIKCNNSTFLKEEDEWVLNIPEDPGRWDEQEYEITLTGIKVNRNDEEDKKMEALIYSYLGNDVIKLVVIQERCPYSAATHYTVTSNVDENVKFNEDLQPEYLEHYKIVRKFSIPDTRAVDYSLKMGDESIQDCIQKDVILSGRQFFNLEIPDLTGNIAFMAQTADKIAGVWLRFSFDIDDDADIKSGPGNQVKWRFADDKNYNILEYAKKFDNESIVPLPGSGDTELSIRKKYEGKEMVFYPLHYANKEEYVYSFEQNVIVTSGMVETNGTNMFINVPVKITKRYDINDGDIKEEIIGTIFNINPSVINAPYSGGDFQIDYTYTGNDNKLVVEIDSEYQEYVKSSEIDTTGKKINISLDENTSYEDVEFEITIYDKDDTSINRVLRVKIAAAERPIEVWEDNAIYFTLLHDELWVNIDKKVYFDIEIQCVFWTAVGEYKNVTVTIAHDNLSAKVQGITADQLANFYIFDNCLIDGVGLGEYIKNGYRFYLSYTRSTAEFHAITGSNTLKWGKSTPGTRTLKIVDGDEDTAEKDPGNPNLRYRVFNIAYDNFDSGVTLSCETSPVYDKYIYNFDLHLEPYDNTHDAYNQTATIRFNINTTDIPVDFDVEIFDVSHPELRDTIKVRLPHDEPEIVLKNIPIYFAYDSSDNVKAMLGEACYVPVDIIFELLFETRQGEETFNETLTIPAGTTAQTFSYINHIDIERCEYFRESRPDPEDIISSNIDYHFYFDSQKSSEDFVESVAGLDFKWGQPKK